MFYQEKNLPEKAATMKGFEYLPLGKEWKVKTNIAASKIRQYLRVW